MTARLRDARWHVNRKRLGRIWRGEGLNVPHKQPSRGRLWLNEGSCIRRRPEFRRYAWAYESDKGGPIKWVLRVNVSSRKFQGHTKQKLIKGRRWAKGNLTEFPYECDFKDDLLVDGELRCVVQFIAAVAYR